MRIWEAYFFFLTKTTKIYFGMEINFYWASFRGFLQSDYLSIYLSIFFLYVRIFEIFKTSVFASFGINAKLSMSDYVMVMVSCVFQSVISITQHSPMS